MHYTSPRHARLFRNVARAKGHTPHTLAAIYLLTAKKKLWKKWQRAVTNQGIDWDGNRHLDSSWEGYHLERAAHSIAKCTAPQVTLRDLADSTAYPQERLRLVAAALWIARNDPQAIAEIIEERRNTPC